MQNSLWRIALTLLLVFLSDISFGQLVELRTISRRTGAPSGFINDIAQDNDGRILFATDRGLFSYNGIDYKSIVSDDYVAAVKRTDKGIYFTIGNKLFRNESSGLIASLPEDEQIIDFQADGESAWVLSQENLYRVVMGKVTFTRELEEVGVQLIRLNQKLHLITENSIYRVPVIREPLEKLYESENLITSVAGQNEKVIVGTDAGWEVLKEFKSLKVIEGEDCRSVVPFDSGWLLISAERVVWLKENDEFIELDNPELLTNDIHDAFVDVDDGWWFMTRGRGCYFIPSPGLLFDTKPLSSFGNEKVNAIRQVGNDCFYATKNGCFVKRSGSVQLLVSEELLDVEVIGDRLYGTTRNNGVLVQSISTGEKQYLTISSGLSHNFIRSITKMGDKLIAVPKNGKINFIVGDQVVDAELDARFEKLRVNQLAYSSKDRRLYVLELGGSLHMYDQLSKSWSRMESGMVGRSLECIDNELFILGNDRLGWLNDDQVKEYSLPVSWNEFQVVKGGVKQNGLYVFSSSEGQLLVDTKLLDRTWAAPKLKVTSVQLNDEIVPFQEHYDLGFGSYRLQVNVELIDLKKIGDRPVYWNFNGSFGRAQTVQNGLVEIPEISEGKHVVVLWTDKDRGSKKMAITVAAPFWKGVWFWLILAVMLIAIVWLIVRWRVARLSREQQRLEQLVAIKTTELVERNKDVEQIAYAISHDFKTPLNTVHELLKLNDNAAISSEQKAMGVTMATTKTGQLLGNMSGLIELLKIGAQEEEWESIQLEEVLKEVTDSLEAVIVEKDAIIHQFMSVKGLDGIRPYIFSIFHNLIANALKYHQPGVPPEITVETERQDGLIRISIADKGLGMDMKKHGDDLLRPFRQVNAQSEGVGLGLSIVKRMIDVHQGKLTIESEPGVGTKFSIEIPERAEN